MDWSTDHTSGRILHVALFWECIFKDYHDGVQVDTITILISELVLQEPHIWIPQCTHSQLGQHLPVKLGSSQ